MNMIEILGNKLGAVISNEIEKRVTLLMDAHSDYLNYSEDRANPELCKSKNIQLNIKNL